MQGFLRKKDIRRKVRIGQTNCILKTGDQIIHEEHVEMMSEIYNKEGKLNHTQASNALENGDYNGYPELNPKRQNKRAKHKIDQAYDALENGNHSEHEDMPLEGKNKEGINESGLNELLTIREIKIIQAMMTMRTWL